MRVDGLAGAPAWHNNGRWWLMVWVPDRRSRSLSSGAHSRDPLVRLSGTTTMTDSNFENRGRRECRVPAAPAATQLSHWDSTSPYHVELDGASRCIDGAGELHQHTAAGRLDLS